MDSRSEAALDTTLQHELFYNVRVVNHPTFGAVTLARPTLDREKAIAEARRKQFQTDMKNPDILSRAQLEKLAIEREMWTPDMSAKIKLLTEKTGEAIGLLEAIGFRSFEEVFADYQHTVQELLDIYADSEDADEDLRLLPVREAIHRLFSLDATPIAADRRLIMDAAPGTSVDDLMETGSGMRVQLDLLSEMVVVRKELNELQSKQTRLFLDSVESRSDRAEELATIFHCARDADDKPLWPDIDAMRTAKIEDVEEVLLEYHYFRNGVTSEFKATLGKYGFLKRLTATTDSRVASPDQPSVSSDGVSPEPEPTSSSEVTV